MRLYSCAEGLWEGGDPHQEAQQATLLSDLVSLAASVVASWRRT